MSTTDKTDEKVYSEEEIKAAEDYLAAAPDLDPAKPLPAEEAAKMNDALKVAKTAIAQKKHFRDKFEAAEAELKKLKPEPAATVPPKPAEKHKIDKADALEFRQDEGLSKETMELVVEEAELRGITLAEAVKRPHLASYIKAQKDSADNANASVAPSRRGAAAPSADTKDWSKVSKEDVLKKRNSVLQNRNQS